MIKALSATAIAAFMAAAITLLPGFAPDVEASGTHALPKSDRLPIAPTGTDCTSTPWPHTEAPCLWQRGTHAPVMAARLTKYIR